MTLNARAADVDCGATAGKAGSRPGSDERARIKKRVCADKNMGSAIGAGACYAIMRCDAESLLAPLQRQHTNWIVANSDNPDNARNIAEDEALKWRQYRDAKCLLHVETEGGSDAWKNTWEALCVAEETERRANVLHKILRSKDSSSAQGIAE